ncbi:hypothetical protein ACMA1D_00500 [Streptomyces sp. 796.1]|uniref:hypothetical protein n=1 Tax=Streptomyces sp. 796.1 TaxID=3163029 RepID=UPI0039C9D307
MNLNLVNDVPAGLTRRARSFVSAHGVKADVRPVEGHRQWWLERDVPAEVIDRMAAFQQQWNGLLLPPGPQYEGGPKYLDPDSPEADSTGWWFEPGAPRASVAYGFLISPSGEFGIHTDRWVPLHASTEGWVESVALAHHASRWAKQVTRLTGDDADGLDLRGFEPVDEVRGRADTWWRGPDSLVALYSGEAEAFDFPEGRVAMVYSGLDAWGLRAGVGADEG